ncbi:MAG: peptidylprolyl isomerase [Pirellulales bacterium]|nr:peptidylprolyl isomerase [Pirellulales bacterium]
MRWFGLPMAAWAFLAAAMVGGGRARGEAEPAADNHAVVATVDNEPITAGEVDRWFQRVTRGQDVNPAAVPLLRAQVLSEIVDRRLVLAYARRMQSGATSTEVESELDSLKSRLAAQQRSLNDLLAERSITEADLRRQITWKLTWKEYLQRYLTEKRLTEFFHAHRREFDGTTMSVSHLLLRPEADAGPRAMAALVEKARAIRESIVSGKMSFGEAAREYSAGPSAAAGGLLGPIDRRGSMVESFSRAAFGLEVGQVSEPVRTRFGVHLIHCAEIQPGSKQPAEVRKQLEEALARELLERLARLQQTQTPVSYTGEAPYFRPGTRELVVP